MYVDVGYCAALLDIAAVVFAAAGAFVNFAAGDGAAGSIAVVDAADLDVVHNAVVLLIMLMSVTGNVGCSY